MKTFLIRNKKTILLCLIGVFIYYLGREDGYNDGYHLGMIDCLETHIADKKIGKD